MFDVGERSLSATVSIGGVQIGEKIASVTQVLAKASQGVQSSVGVGGNRAEIFDPGAVDRAAATWSRVASAQVRFAPQGMTTALPEIVDGRSTIGFLDRPDLDQVLGATSFIIDDTSGATS